MDSVVPAGADTTDGTSIALNPPASVGDSNRIEVTWQAQGDLTSFTVLAERAAGLGFEAVDATVGNNSAQFARGAAYRLDFPTASVRVRGCDASNQCVDSNAQPLLDVLLAGIAQVAPNPQTRTLFGHTVALSADGNTLAAGSTEKDPNQPGQWAVRIFQRGDDGRWVQEARLERFAIEASFGPFALSGDGQTLVVGAPEHSGTVGGINAPEASAPPPEPPSVDIGQLTGAIHVFTRDAQQRQWSRQSFIKAAVPVDFEQMGHRVAVSHDGNRVLAAAASKMYLFERTNGQWRQARIFDSSSIVILPTIGMALGADGRTIAVTEGAFPGELLPQSVAVYKECQCSEGWRPVARLSSARPPPSRFNEGDDYGSSLSLSGDGNVLAVGAPLDSGDEACDGTTMNTAAPAAGAAYIFAVDSSGVWQRRAFLKARTAVQNDVLGSAVALSGDGKVLAAKACGYAANAQALRRNHRADATIGQLPGDSSCASFGGASYVFEESPAGTWSHTAAAIPAPGERVGYSFFSIALSADAQTLGLGLNTFSGGEISGRVQVY